MYILYSVFIGNKVEPKSKFLLAMYYVYNLCSCVNALVVMLASKC